MSHALVLMAPAPSDHMAGLADRARAAIPVAGDATWLAADMAAELPLPEASGETVRSWRETVAALIGDAPVDNAIIRSEGRQKRLLVADMDSTIIAQECIDEVAHAAGIKPQVAAITERAMRGDLDFEQALRERVALLRGLPEAALAQVLEERITLNPGARELVATMRAHGAYTVLVSGGFTFFTDAVAARAGFDANSANKLLFRDGELIGVAEPILGREAKRDRLIAQAEALDMPLSETLAIGDGANDLAMLELAGLGVAYHAKPVV
ncbi:MAG: phosphoserine phosphatase SerB, partial [Dichotomicrobium sp.]